MSTWQLSGIELSIAQGKVIIKAASGFAKVKLGGIERVIPFDEVVGLAYLAPKMGSGKVKISDHFFTTSIMFAAKEVETATKIFQSLTEACPAANENKVSTKAWSEMAEKSLVENAKSKEINLDKLTDIDELNELTERSKKETKEAKIASKAAAAQKKAADKNAKAAEKARLEEEHAEKYGSLVVHETCAGKGIWIYSKGFVSFGLFSPGTPEKLLGISGNADVAKKTAIGRGAVAAVTMGANLLLTPNKRGDMYLSITTSRGTKMLHMSPPTERDMKAMHRLQGAGQAVLNTIQGDVAMATSGATQQVASKLITEPTDLAAQLGKLTVLHESGALSEDEFKAAKAKLIGS